MMDIVYIMRERQKRRGKEGERKKERKNHASAVMAISLAWLVNTMMNEI